MNSFLSSINYACLPWHTVFSCWLPVLFFVTLIYLVSFLVALYLFIFKSFFIVILLQLSQFVPLCPPLPIPPSCSHSQSPHCCPCPWVIHTCSLSSSSPSFHHYSPSPSLLVTVSRFHVSLPVVLFRALVCSLDLDRPILELSALYRGLYHA